MTKTYNNKDYYKVGEEWFTTDKNNKEYKVFHQSILKNLNKLEITGFGDVVKAVTNSVGISTCQKCEERRKTLNKLFPFIGKKEVGELSTEEKEVVASIKENSLIPTEKVKQLFDMYNRVFHQKVKRCNCPGLVRVIVERLKQL